MKPLLRYTTILVLLLPGFLGGCGTGVEDVIPGPAGDPILPSAGSAGAPIPPGSVRPRPGDAITVAANRSFAVTGDITRDFVTFSSDAPAEINRNLLTWRVGFARDRFGNVPRDVNGIPLIVGTLLNRNAFDAGIPASEVDAVDEWMGPTAVYRAPDLVTERFAVSILVTAPLSGGSDAAARLQTAPAGEFLVAEFVIEVRPPAGTLQIVASAQPAIVTFAGNGTREDGTAARETVLRAEITGGTPFLESDAQALYNVVWFVGGQRLTAEDQSELVRIEDGRIISTRTFAAEGDAFADLAGSVPLFTVEAEDSDGSVASDVVSITVARELTATVTRLQNTAVIGAPADLTATVVGGVAPYSFTWSSSNDVLTAADFQPANTGESNQSHSVSFIVPATATTVRVVATDADGNSTAAEFEIGGITPGGGGGGTTAPLTVSITRQLVNLDGLTITGVLAGDRDRVDLTATISNAVGNATFQWTALPDLGTFADPTSSTTTWLPPTVADQDGILANGESVTLQVSVTDSNSPAPQRESDLTSISLGRTLVFNNAVAVPVTAVQTENVDMFVSFGGGLGGETFTWVQNRLPSQQLIQFGGTAVPVDPANPAAGVTTTTPEVSLVAPLVDLGDPALNAYTVDVTVADSSGHRVSGSAGFAIQSFVPEILAPDPLPTILNFNQTLDGILVEVPAGGAAPFGWILERGGIVASAAGTFPGGFSATKFAQIQLEPGDPPNVNPPVPPGFAPLVDAGRIRFEFDSCPDCIPSGEFHVFQATVRDSTGAEVSTAPFVVQLAADARPLPRWSADYNGDGYQIAVSFVHELDLMLTEPVDLSAAGAADSNYLVRQNPATFAITDAAFGNGGARRDQVLLTFANQDAVALAGTPVEITLQPTLVTEHGDIVVDRFDEPTNAQVARGVLTVDANPDDVTLPGVDTLALGILAPGNIELLLTFSEAMDESTTGDPLNYNVGGVFAAAATLTGGRDVLLQFVDELPSGADLVIDPVVSDINTNMSAIAPLAIPFPTPQVVSVEWTADFATGYEILVTYSEAMSNAGATPPVRDPSNYRITGTGSFADTVSAVPGSGLTQFLVRFSGIALGVSDALDVNVNGDVAAITGTALGAANAVPIVPAGTLDPADADVTAPAAGGIAFLPGPTEVALRVTVEFDEAMDRDTADDASRYAIGGTATAARAAVVAAVDAVLGADGRTVTLTFAGLLPVGPTLDITDVTDINQNTVTLLGLAIARDPATMATPQVTATDGVLPFGQLEAGFDQQFDLNAVLVDGVAPFTVELRRTGIAAAANLDDEIQIDPAIDTPQPAAPPAAGTVRFLDVAAPDLAALVYPFEVVVRDLLGGQVTDAFDVELKPAPTAAVTSSAAPTTAVSPIPFAVDFGEVVTGFDPVAEPGDLDLVNATLTPATFTDNGGGQFVFSVTPTVIDDDVTVTVPDSAAQDLVGNNTREGIAVVRFDASAPTVTIDQAVAQADPTNASPVVFTVVFNEPVAGFATGDVDLGTSTVGGVLVGTVTEIAPNDGTTYTVSVTGMTTPGDVVAIVPMAVATDAAGNDNAASTSTDNVVFFDATAPTVTIDQGAAQADPTSLSPVVFDVVFDEPVGGFATGDVDFTGSTVGGVLTGTVTEIAPLDGTTYVVSVTGMTTQGDIIATISADVAADAVANGNEASTSADNVVFFDATPPTVTIDQAAGQADPANASPIEFTAVFSEPVFGFVTGDVDLSTSTVGGVLTGTVTEIAPNDGTTYTVSVTGMTTPGDVIAFIPLAVATDGVANDNEASTSADNVVFFDASAPMVTIEQGAAQADPTNALSVEFDVVFNEPVAGFATGDVDFTGSTVGGALTGAVTEVAPNDGTTYIVSVTGMTTPGSVVATIPMGVATDLAGNGNGASTSADNDVFFDATGPALDSAVSRMTHGAAGDFDVDLPLAAPDGVEPRLGGPTRVIITFTEAIVANDGSLDIGDEVTVAGSALATLTTLQINGNELIVEMTVPMDGCVTLSIETGAGGITDLLGNPLVGDNDLSIVSLEGDVVASGDVVSAGMPAGRDTDATAAAATGTVTTDAEARFDVDLDGDVDGDDETEVAARVGNTASCP